MKKIMLMILLTIFSVNLVDASIYVSSSPDESIRFGNKNAVFDVNLGNSDSSSDRITYVVQDINWNAEKKYFDLSSNEKVDFKLELKPLKALSSGKYTVIVRFYSDLKTNYYKDYNFVVDNLNNENILNYDFNINPSGLNPRKENIIVLSLTNTKNIDLGTVNVELTGLLQKSFKVSLDSLGTTEKEFNVYIDESIASGEYDVNILIKDDRYTYLDKKAKIKVGEYSNFVENKEVDSGFLKTTVLLKQENNGNNRVIKDVAYELGSFEKYFTKFNIEPGKAEDNIYNWEIDLKAKESKEIIITTSYRAPLAYLILAILLVYLFYRFVKKQVSVTKKVLTIKTDSGIADMKVMLVIKNKGSAIKNLRLVDYIPAMIKSPEHYATVKPVNVKKTSRGLMLDWTIGDLLRREERVISYRIKTNVKVIGKMNIPRAFASYHIGNKREVVGSNMVTISSK